MTNAEKLTAVYNLTGPTLFQAILQAVGPGSVYVPKSMGAARRENRNLSILADYFNAPENLSDREIYLELAERYNLRPDTIRKIIKHNTSGSR